VQQKQLNNIYKLISTHASKSPKGLRC